MFARKFNSDGRMRWPAPCRARNATRLPRSVPTMYGPDGSPKGVVTLCSSRSTSSAMSYRPLPPMIPISISLRILSFVSGRRGNDPALAVLFAKIAGRDDWIVFEEHEDLLRDRLF